MPDFLPAYLRKTNTHSLKSLGLGVLCLIFVATNCTSALFFHQLTRI